MDKKPNLLITGSTGYLGAWIVKYAVEKGNDFLF